MKNSIKSKNKLSKLERAINKYIILMAVVQIVACLITSICYVIWTLEYKDIYLYLSLNYDYYDTFFQIWGVSFGQWYLLFMNFVPISLMVTLECVKFIQAYFIGWDYRIYDLEKDMPTKV